MRIPRPLAAAAAALALFPAAVGAQHHYQCGAPPPLTEARVPLWPGVSGTVTFDRVSSSDSAQRYFEQGLALIYGFNHLESVLSFRKAATFDRGCAMCYWGVAIALGPNINEPINAQRWYMAAAHADSARRRVRPNDILARRYVSAAVARYALPATPLERLTPAEFTRVRAQRDTAYAAVMKGVWEASGERDLTAGSMYTEALMDLSPWNQWNIDGTPKFSSTVEALNVLRTVLRQKPDHVGAAHLWIHMLEGSHRPDLAVQQADMLERLMPGAAHITHMPSHIYHRVGRFSTGVAHNERATAEDREYLAYRGWMWRYPMYFAHDHDFLWVSASFAGMRDQAAASADSLRGIFGATGGAGAQLIECYANAQHFLSAPILVAVRFGEWDRAIRVERPEARYRFPTGVWHYGQGWARLRTGDRAAAERHRDSVMAIANGMGSATISNNSAADLLRIQGLTLTGEILASERRYGEAIAALDSAVRMQDRLSYDEPPPFFYPTRHSLGAVLVESGIRANSQRAVEVYLTDLGDRDEHDYSVKRNPDNAWAYVGMANAVRSLGFDPSHWLNRATGVWKGGKLPPSSRY
jgi:tetratricopeptide (TPR) repeat protein